MLGPYQTNLESHGAGGAADGNCRPEGAKQTHGRGQPEIVELAKQLIHDRGRPEHVLGPSL